MPEQTIEKRIEDALVEHLGINPSQVVPEARFVDDLGCDSLDTVELIMAFEEEFNIEVPDEEAERLLTVQDAVEYAKNHT